MSAVERAAEAFYEDPEDLTSWERMAEVEPDLADRYRNAIRRALAAALDVDELARVLHDAACTCDGITHTPQWWENRERSARAVIAHLTKGTGDE